MAYEPENTALPTEHLEELRFGAKAIEFNRHFAAFQTEWQHLFRAWLEAHDRQLLEAHGVTDAQAEG